MRADYQLKHQLYGQQGSLWEKQVDDTTRLRIRRIVKEAGNANVLTQTDRIASSALNSDKVLVEGVFFKFNAGDYAVVGQAQRDYNFRLGDLDDGTRLHVAYRGTYAQKEPEGVPTLLAKVSQDFLKVISTLSLQTDRDWYLIPVPRDITPIVIEGKSEDKYLVSGIDFIARNGYIAMPDDPETVLSPGLVRIECAYKFTPPVLSASSGGKYVTEYSKKSQSVAAFKMAIAEYSGMYVTQTADVVLDVLPIGEGSTVYNLAAAGPVEINYPHDGPTKSQTLQPGYIFSGRFDVIGSGGSTGVSLKKLVASDWNSGIMLDGILPIKGLTWDGKSPVPVDYVTTGEGGKPHLRLHFEGPTLRLERFWEFQRLHELQTGVYLYDALGLEAVPTFVDFWELLDGFYGSQLLLVLLGNHSPSINARAWSFAVVHRPQSCNILLGVDVGGATLTLDDRGVPILAEDNESYYRVEDPLFGLSNYYRPDGESVYLRPSSAGYYLRPD
jgi:hypothetical protein